MQSLSDLLYPGSRVAIVGSRDFPVPSLVESFVSDLSEVIVVSGSDYNRWKNGGSVNSCGGIVDLTAVSSARLFGLEVDEFPPEWNRYGRGAGKVRNGRLVDSGLSVLVAFAKDPSRLSRGTSDVVKKAVSAGVPVFVFGPDGSER
jgi:hypothetical protein